MDAMKLPALAVVALALVAGAAAATGPKVALTSPGNAAAKASLIMLSDLGKGWTSKPAQTGGLQVACSGYQPSFAGVVETGAAGTPAFSAGTVGPFLSQITSVYGSATEASAVWNRAIQAGLITCVAQSVKAIGATGQGVKVKITSQEPLAIQKATTRETAYRVIATLTSAKVKYKRTIYFDVVVVGKASTIAEITFSSFQAPVPAKVEAALGALVAHRIGLPTA
jgi:hypothetical protein